MKPLRLVALLSLAALISVQAQTSSPLPNQERITAPALAGPDTGNPPQASPFTPRALLVSPTTGALWVEEKGTAGAAANTAIGTTADAPSTAVQDATARTVVSLLKGIQNYLRDLAGNLAVADGAAISGNGVLIAGSDGTNKQTITTDTSGNQIVVGSTASGAADSGNPVKIGGRYYTTQPTLTDGQRGDAQSDSRGNLRVSLMANNTAQQMNTNPSDTFSQGSSGQSLQTWALNGLYNGSTWDRWRGDTTGGAWVQGAVASGATDTGNPVKVGGRYNSTKPTLTNGQRGDTQLDARGNMQVTVFGADSATPAVVGTVGDAGSLSNHFFVASANRVSNGATLDLERGNTSAVSLASAARTTTQTSADLTNHNARGIHWTIDVTAIVDTPSLTPTIQAKDANGIYYTVMTGTAITATGTYLFELYPGATVAAGASVSRPLPRTFRLVITAADADSATYSSAYSLIN